MNEEKDYSYVKWIIALISLILLCLFVGWKTSLIFNVGLIVGYIYGGHI